MDADGVPRRAEDALVTEDFQGLVDAFPGDAYQMTQLILGDGQDMIRIIFHIGRTRLYKFNQFFFQSRRDVQEAHLRQLIVRLPQAHGKGGENSRDCMIAGLQKR